MAKVDSAKALAAGYTQAEIDAENARRARVEAEATTAKQDAALKSGGGEGNFIENLTAGAGKALTDMTLGGRQLAASLPGVGQFLGDKEALAKEVAEKAKHDAALSRTGGGMIGDLATNVGMSFLPMGMAARVAKGATGMLPQLARAATAGAGMETLAPEEDYSLGKQLAKGAAFGIGGDIVGRGAGLLYAPFRNRKVGATAAENAALLNAEGLPKQIPATQTDSPMVQAATNALEQVPGLGRWVTKAREANAGWLTSKATEPTGRAVTELPQSARDAMFNRLNAEGNAFRTGDPINMSNIGDVASDAAENVRRYAEAASKEGKLSKLTNPAESFAPTPLKQPPTPQPSVIIGAPPPVAPLPIQGPPRPAMRTADEVMDLRNAASELAHGETDPVLKQEYRKYREALADSLRDVHGEQRVNNWLRQWGAMEDVTRAAGGKSGKELVGGKLTPERLAMNLDDSFRPGTKLDKIISAAAENMPTPPKGWNRAMITSLILGGAPIAAGAAHDVIRGEPGIGTGLGGALSASLISGLSRKAPSQANIDAVIKALTAAGIGVGQQF